MGRRAHLNLPIRRRCENISPPGTYSMTMYKFELSCGKHQVIRALLPKPRAPSAGLVPWPGRCSVDSASFFDIASYFGTFYGFDSVSYVHRNGENMMSLVCKPEIPVAPRDEH